MLVIIIIIIIIFVTFKEGDRVVESSTIASQLISTELFRSKPVKHIQLVSIVGSNDRSAIDMPRVLDPRTGGVRQNPLVQRGDFCHVPTSLLACVRHTEAETRRASLWIVGVQVEETGLASFAPFAFHMILTLTVTYRT